MKRLAALLAAVAVLTVASPAHASSGYVHRGPAGNDYYAVTQCIFADSFVAMPYSFGPPPGWLYLPPNPQATMAFTLRQCDSGTVLYSAAITGYDRSGLRNPAAHGWVYVVLSVTCNCPDDSYIWEYKADPDASHGPYFYS